MAQGVRVFKSPSKLDFRIVRPESGMLRDTDRGDVFMREGSLCMRVEMSGPLPEQKEFCERTATYPIINLQTGRVWAAPDCCIEYVKAVVTLEGQ